MSTHSHKIRELLDDSLSELDDSLGTTGDDARLLTAVEQRIDSLLRANGSIEGEIRGVLRERYNDGDLRTETYELVRSILDRRVAEEVRTEPTDNVAPARDAMRELDLATAQLVTTTVTDDEYSSTAVLHEQLRPPVTADDKVQVGSILRDRFLLQERLSGGSMGVVYKALDRRMAEAGAAEPWVAVKVLSPQLSKNGTALRALQQEAAKGRCLSHAHIVRFIDLDREDDLYFIVMEWLDGKTLAEMLDSAEGKAMGTDQAIGILRQLASALGYAHRCGIVHADVKPANVMILPNGDAKLFDFGVARVRQTQKLSRHDFDPGVLGALTPAYSSMQVLTGEEPVPADDVFSLGCLFYRLVAGHRVFGPRNAAEAAEEGMTPQQPQGLTDGQWRALRKAISFSRVTRFQNMPEFMNELEDRSVVSIDIGAPGHLDEDDAGGSRSWLFGLVALLLLLGFAIYEFGFSDPFGWTRQAGSWIDDQVAAFSDDAPEETRVPAETTDDDIIDLPAEADDPIAEVGGAPGESTGREAASGDVADAPGAVEAADIPPAADTHTEAAAHAALPPADVEVSLNDTSAEPPPVSVTLREDGGPTLVDVRRSGNLDLPLRLRVEEVGYTGNRSPWASRQYTIADDGNIEMAPGEVQARLSLEMASDALRESDQLSTLRLRSPDSTTTQYATLEVTLEDDDQRSFESGLPVNTVGFATSQIAVRESDPVVQIDVSRFNPDDTQIVIGYTVGDIGAKEGEDYFAPGGYSVSFGPGQRTARLLIPLVQDNLREGDEAFTVELATRDQEDVPDVFERIMVTIRDDDR